MIALYIILSIVAILIMLLSKQGREILHKVSGLSLILSELVILLYIFLAIYTFFYFEIPSSSFKNWLIPVLGMGIILVIISISGDLFIKNTKEKIIKNQPGYFLVIFLLFLIIITTW